MSPIAVILSREKSALGQLCVVFGSIYEDHERLFLTGSTHSILFVLHTVCLCVIRQINSGVESFKNVP